MNLETKNETKQKREFVGGFVSPEVAQWVRSTAESKKVYIQDFLADIIRAEMRREQETNAK
jgi:hypothetical protein